MPILYIDESTADTQLARLEELGARATTTRFAARSTRSAPPRADRRTHVSAARCARAYATVGEMCDTLRDVWGEYEEVPII